MQAENKNSSKIKTRKNCTPVAIIKISFIPLVLLYIIYWEKRTFTLIQICIEKKQSKLVTIKTRRRTFPVSEAKETNSKQLKDHVKLARTGYKGTPFSKTSKMHFFPFRSRWLRGFPQNLIPRGNYN